MANFRISSCCNTVLEKEGLCKCETLFVSDLDKCPECGCNTVSYNDPGMDSAMSEWCTNKDCEYTSNQFMSWEEIKEEM